MGTQFSNALSLGCIADDFTGATDLANNLVRAGMRVVQSIGVPESPVLDADAVVIALKSRTISATDAIQESLTALTWLRGAGAKQIYFKVCSTFDSTTKGNIGPVAEALLRELGGGFCCVTPAFPENQRTVFKGHLFVGDVLLSESGMRNHPLTPMTDANLVRVLQSQTAGSVGLIDHAVIRRGSEAIRARMSELEQSGIRFAIVDAITNDDLLVLGHALRDAHLVVAGSGVAIGLPPNFGLQPSVAAATLPPPRGHSAIVSGSCSTATNAQVAAYLQAGHPAFAVDPLQLFSGKDIVTSALAWADVHVGKGPVLVYSSAPPEVVSKIQNQLGVSDAGTLIEQVLASIAVGLVERGVGRLLVAGGETSGACVKALGIKQMRIGPQIDPGVPWCFAETSVEGRSVHLALKSGNFGTVDFFTKAFKQL